jgi:hypothetical protein
MGVFYFPTDFVYWKNIDEHNNFKKELLNQIENNKQMFSETPYIDKGEGTVQNSLGLWIIENNPTIMKTVVWNSLDALLKELNSRPNHKPINIKSSFISNCWFLKYNSGATTSLHCHNDDNPSIVKNNKIYKCVFSFIYIINDDNEKNQTEFIQPTMSGTNVSERCDVRFKTSEIEDIKEGTIMIFPSSLYHQVNVMSKPNRVIFSGNIYSTFE